MAVRTGDRTVFGCAARLGDVIGIGDGVGFNAGITGIASGNEATFDSDFFDRVRI
jgi:hypothetical protein